MAKRKLSSAQRRAVRKTIAKALKAGRKPAEIMREVAKRYGITPVSARWYLRAAAPANGHRKAAARRNVRKGVSRVQARRVALKNGDGIRLSLLNAVESRAAATLRKAKKARRLLPHWRSLVKREKSLGLAQAQRERELSEVRKRAKEMGARIKALLGS